MDDRREDLVSFDHDQLLKSAEVVMFKFINLNNEKDDNVFSTTSEDVSDD